MKYDISLEAMEFYAFHGCYDLEQQVGNRFEVTLTVTSEMEGSMEDDVTNMVSYLTMYQLVAEQMKRTQRTIECVALNIIGAIKAHDSRVLSVRCRVTKLAPPLGGKVRGASVEFSL